MLLVIPKVALWRATLLYCNLGYVISMVKNLIWLWLPLLIFIPKPPLHLSIPYFSLREAPGQGAPAKEKRW